VPSDYRFSQPLLVRFLGALLVLVGVVVLGTATLVAVLDLPRLVLTVTVVACVAVVLVAAVLLGRLRILVHLDEVGYRVRWLRAAGVKRATWREVEDVVTMTVAGHNCIVLRLRDGRTTTVPVQLLDADPEAFVGDLGRHLDKGHGYRRLS
jgi:hypothetical protein